MAKQRRVALVTGGAKRVGRAIVERLVADGFEVVFTYLSSAADARRMHRRLGAIPIQADLTQPESAVRQIVQDLKQRSERLDVLINSASLYEARSLARADLAHARRLMAIHFESPLLLAKALAPKLRSSKGHVVNMIDLLAERPWPQYLAYCASKAALANLTLGLARELAPEVTVNGIAPGVVEWPPDYPKMEQRKYLKRVPLGRAGSPQDVANLIHFLVTEGTYVTGQIIRLDGGRSIA